MGAELHVGPHSVTCRWGRLVGGPSPRCQHSAATSELHWGWGECRGQTELLGTQGGLCYADCCGLVGADLLGHLWV